MLKIAACCPVDLICICRNECDACTHVYAPVSMITRGPIGRVVISCDCGPRRRQSGRRYGQPKTSGALHARRPHPHTRRQLASFDTLSLRHLAQPCICSEPIGPSETSTGVGAQAGVRHPQRLASHTRASIGPFTGRQIRRGRELMGRIVSITGALSIFAALYLRHRKPEKELDLQFRKRQNHDKHADADAGDKADKPPPDSKSFAGNAQSLLGFLIAGFAAVLSFIGIKSSELASILRNEEPFVGIVALAFLLSIVTAILSIFNSTAARDESETAQNTPGWPTRRFALATLLFLFALVTLLPAVIHIPFVTSSAQIKCSIVISALLAISGSVVAVPYKGKPRKKLPSFISWGNGPCDPQLYFVLLSILFLTIAAYGALRLESASQASPFAQLDGTVTTVNSNSAVLSLTVASAKVPAPDRVDITVTGLPRTVNIKTLCNGTKTPLNSFSCTADPCSYKSSACNSLVGWTIPPNETGAVQETLVVPFSPSDYQRLHVEDQLCQRANATQQCASVPPGGTHLDVAIPAPSG